MPLSVLDLSPVVSGSTVSVALRSTLDLAKFTKSLGYYRYWLAEHHNMPAIASSATAVLIGQVAAATETIRVGSGGVMLPNHVPIVIAEQFGTLEASIRDGSTSASAEPPVAASARRSRCAKRAGVPRRASRSSSPS